MFKVASDRKFTHPVTVCVPVDNGHIDQTFKVTFRVLDATEMEQDGSVESQKSVLRKIIVEMHDLIDADDQPVSYSDALRDELISLPFVRVALNNVYIKAMTKAKAGN